MGFKSNGIKWTWDESITLCPNYYTTTTSADDTEELKINARKWKGDFIVNSPTTPTPTVTSYGWICPKCGCVNAPWVSSCPCATPPMKITC